jgi:16S rRNA (cytosine1402-N4)-methyltransferase
VSSAKTVFHGGQHIRINARRGDQKRMPMTTAPDTPGQNDPADKNEPQPGDHPPFQHVPVMAGEVVDTFRSVPAGWLVDMTLGGAGHAALLLEARPDCRLLGLDRDPVALSAARATLEPFGDRAVTAQVRFDQLTDVMTEMHIDSSTGVLFDLGVSSPQFDDPERGFSYRADAALDMRMDPGQPWSAADVVNGYAEADLARILREFGDERFAARIAAAIVAARPVETTGQLAEIVRAAIPAATRRRGGHPAKRTFQSIRIEVNAELAALPSALDQAIDVTEPGGRVAALSYHSGEDRIVKDRFRYAATGGCECPAGLPCVCNAVRTVRIVRPEKRTPSREEVARNPRAASAVLRVVERIVATTGRAAGGRGAGA